MMEIKLPRIEIRKYSDDRLRKNIKKDAWYCTIVMGGGVFCTIISTFDYWFGFMGLALMLFAFWGYNNIREAKFILEIRELKKQ